MSSLMTVPVRSISLVLAFALMAFAQEPPPLEPPALEPPRANTARPAQTNASTKPAAPKPERRPMLAIPGVTAPSSRRPVVRSTPTIPPLEATSEGIPLSSGFPETRPLPEIHRDPTDGPPGPAPYDSSPPPPPSFLSPRRSSSGPRVTPRTPPGETIPLTVEPFDEPPAGLRGSTGRSPAPRSSDSRYSAAKPVRPNVERITPRPMPRRSPGFFGRLFGLTPPPQPLPREESRPLEKPKSGRKTDDDKNPDVIVRRRIESQVRATVGDRVRYFDVTVDGRNVVIFAQPTRFWFRRSVRRSLETLPSIQGYRTRIEVGQ